MLALEFSFRGDDLTLKKFDGQEMCDRFMLFLPSCDSTWYLCERCLREVSVCKISRDILWFDSFITISLLAHSHERIVCNFALILSCHVRRSRLRFLSSSSHGLQSFEFHPFTSHVSHPTLVERMKQQEARDLTTDIPQYKSTVSKRERERERGRERINWRKEFSTPSCNHVWCLSLALHDSWDERMWRRNLFSPHHHHF